MKGVGRNSPVQKVQLAGRVEKSVDFSLIISLLNGLKEGKLGASLVSYLLRTYSSCVVEVPQTSFPERYVRDELALLRTTKLSLVTLGSFWA